MSDDDGEVSEALCAVANAILRLGNNDAATRMGAIELHGKSVSESLDKIASAISDLASAVHTLSDTLEVK